MPSAPSPLPEPTGFSYTAGDTIAGKYALEEVLGAGGMGAVFRARNTVIDMPVAIKLIRADLDRDALSGRLLQEARAAAKLAHPAIVRVFDVGKTALGDPFIVMELLHGESLATVLEREGRISSARAVQLLLPIADALSVAHAKGLVHRDVKPDNVFIANDEEGQLQPKLVDFGIVKAEQKSGDSQLTQVGAVVGSPDYMSPEQARGLDHVDLRSDVWSFAVVLYETIVGETPFSSDNYNALLRQIVETEAPTLHDRKAADAELSGIVQRGMRKDAEQRYPSMGHMGRALALWLFEQGVTEDACGVSLEARWLSRTSEPTHPGRISRSSHPDSWPEPPSGVRAISAKMGARLGHAPTVDAGKSAGTPVALGATKAGVTPRERRAYLLAAGAIVTAASILAWLMLRSPRGVEPPPATASAPVRVEARPEPAPLPAPAPAPPPVAAPSVTPSAEIPAAAVREAAPASSAKAVAVPAKSNRSSSVSAAPAPKAADTPTPAPKPASDLLSPY